MRFIQNIMMIGILCALLSSGCSIFGIECTFNNKTNKILMCSVKLNFQSWKRFWALVGPNQSHKMSFGELAGINSVEVTEYDPKKALSEGYKKDGTLFKDVRLGLESVNPGGTLKLGGEYGDNSPDYIKGYFDSRPWHVPPIAFLQSSSEIDKIAGYMSAISNNAGDIAKLVAAAKKGGIKEIDYEMKQILKSSPNFRNTNIVPGKLSPGYSFQPTMILDIYGIEVPTPEKESVFIFVEKAKAK